PAFPAVIAAAQVAVPVAAIVGAVAVGIRIGAVARAIVGLLTAIALCLLRAAVVAAGRARRRRANLLDLAGRGLADGCSLTRRSSAFGALDLPGCLPVDARGLPIGALDLPLGL